jgi:hypothetical protein
MSPKIEVWNDGESWRFKLLDDDGLILAEEYGHMTETSARSAAKRLRREYSGDPFLEGGRQ